MVHALARHTRLLQDYCRHAFDLQNLDYLGEVAEKLRLLAVQTRQNEPLLLAVMRKHKLELGVRIGPLGSVREQPVDQFLKMMVASVKTDSGKWATFTNEELIRAWAEQQGAAHEDWDVEPGFRRLFELPWKLGEHHMTTEGLRGSAYAISDLATRCLLALHYPGLIAGRDKPIIPGERLNSSSFERVTRRIFWWR